jgi:fatty-acyl-CoA synthase
MHRAEPGTYDRTGPIPGSSGTRSYRSGGGPRPGPRTVGEVLQAAAARAPDAPALSVVGSSGVRRMTYGELWDQALVVAARLLEDHRPGNVLATSSPNRRELVVLQFGAALAGMPLVAINPAYREDEFGYVLEHSRAAVLFTAEGSRQPSLAASPALRQVHDIDVFWSERVTGAGVPGPLQARVRPDDVAQIQYTSGTTDRPKGAVIRHVGMTSTAAGFAAGLQLDRHGAWVNPMPLFHTAGNVLGVLGAVTAAAEQVIVPFRADAVLEAVELTRAEVLGAAPTMLHALLEAWPPVRAGGDLRVVYTGGATLEPTFVRRVEGTLGARLSVTFGMTETCGCISMTRPDDDETVRTTTAGRVLPATEVVVTDTATGEELGADQEGELRVRGERVSTGYLAQDGSVTPTVDEAGWLRTGDLGVVTSDGYLRITGRLKDMIKSGGENVAPAEVEAHLMTHPDVAQVAVIGAPDDRWGELVTAFVRLRAGVTVSVEDLDAHCRAALAPHKLPRRWHLTDELPATPSGKVRKQTLRDLVATGGVELTATGR